ncbi:MAG: MBL fold metallo-hydrolase [Candidatus Lokiarchaeota archaeon]|nr:MBL fold metallo-hydrolase [Candidatus Lokiarchaeota archaeon]
MKINFLGTGGSAITAERNGISILIDDETLLDCSEGTTKRLIKIQKIKEIQEILISHFHVDHSIGIFGMLWHYWLVVNRSKTLKIFGPPKIENFVEQILKMTKTPREAFPFPIKYFEFSKSDKMKYDDITALEVPHHKVTLAYRIDRKRSICYTSDMGPNEEIVAFAKNSDLLIHDVSASEKQAEWAHKYYHCTSKDAAINAKKANVKTLVLIHVMPQNEKNKNILVQEARNYFNGEIILAEDLTEIEI